MWELAALAEVAWVASMTVFLILERRSPTATLAWILALAVLPVVGALIYLVLGPRRLKRRKRRRATAALSVRALLKAVDEDPDGEHRNLAQLAAAAVAAGEAPPMPARDLQLFFDGDATYAALEAAIDAAVHHVHVEYYIFNPDEAGTRIRDALIRRAQAGVEIRMVIDGVGSYAAGDKFLAPLRAAGGQVVFFNSVAPSRIRLRLANFRTHRKIVVIDGVVGFTGGMNVTREHAPMYSGAAAWRDTHFKLCGTAVRGLQAVFLEDWFYAFGSAPSGEAYLAPRGDGDRPVQIIASGPDRDAFAIQMFYFAAIATAQHRVWITTPYFVPDEAIMRAITSAALRRVDVRLLIPRKGDSKLVDLAARSYVPDLLSARVKVYAYEPRMIHAKTIVVDDELAIVGSANMDNRSFRLNFEVIAAAYDPAQNAALATAFERDLESATPMTLGEFAKLRWRTRLGQASARLLSPLL
jgi:cardiolipin synthase